jgi:hypothetical protein
MSKDHPHLYVALQHHQFPMWDKTQQSPPSHIGTNSSSITTIRVISRRRYLGPESNSSVTTIRVTIWRHFPRFLRPSALIPLVRVAQQIPARPAIPTSWCPIRPRSTRVHNNKVLGLTQPKRLAYWVRTAPTYMLCSPAINFWCGTKPNNLPRHTLGPTLLSQSSVWSPEDVIRAPNPTLQSQPSVWPSGDVHGLPRHHVTRRYFTKFCWPSALIPLVRVAQRNPAQLAIPTSPLPCLRFTRAHNKKAFGPNSTQKTGLLGEDCPHLHVVVDG